MRTFYQESQKANIRLNSAQLLTLLRADPHFTEYTADQLEQDLAALCRWRNLVPIQDPHRPASIAEYKNKQFSYSMSQTATEIERMTLSLENLNLRTAVLSSELFERILDTLDRISRQPDQTPELLNQRWDLLQRDFRQLTNRYQDYLREFYSTHAEHILKTTEFLPYKDKVVRYLQEFVLELQRYAEKIRRMLTAFPPEQVEIMLETIYQAQLKEGEGRLIQRSADYPLQLREEIYGFWQGFYRWFVPAENAQSDSQHVLDLAKEHGLHSIALSAISTGRFSYPKAEAAAVAVDAVRRWKWEHSDYALEIIFADMDLVTYRCFCKAFKTKENSQ